MASSTTHELIKFTENLIHDYRNLVYETKRKYVSIKDQAELRIKSAKDMLNNENDMREKYIQDNLLYLSPFLDGIRTKQPKIVNICITSIQKFISSRLIVEVCAKELIDTLWDLLSSNIEELKILQTVVLVLTTGCIIRDLEVAKAFSICLRLHASKIKAVSNTAAATTRQAVSAIFDRAASTLASPSNDINPSSSMPSDESIRQSFALKDAFLLFHDVCLLANCEPSVWLEGIQDMSILLALDIIDYVLVNYTALFTQHDNFKKTLKERVCPMAIRLLSAPNKVSETSDAHNEISFPVTLRNLHLVLTIITNYYNLLETECEIFLTNLAKHIDVDQVAWKCALSLEVIFRIIQTPQLVYSICNSFDMNSDASEVLKHLISTLCGYIQNVLLKNPTNNGFPKDTITTASPSNNFGPGGQSALIYRNYIFRLHLCPKNTLSTLSAGRAYDLACKLKNTGYDMSEVIDAPTPPEGYCLSLAILATLEIVWVMKSQIENNKKNLINVRNLTFAGEPVTANLKSIDDLQKVENASLKKDSRLNKKLVEQSWSALLAVFSILYDASACEQASEQFLRAQAVMVALCGRLDMCVEREAFATILCRSTLPNNYYTSFAKHTKIHSGLTQSIGTSSASTAEEICERSNIVMMIGGNQVNQSTIINQSSSSAQKQSNQNPNVTTGSNAISGINAQNALVITGKHVQAAKAILELAYIDGRHIGTSWPLILSTLQHLAWIYDLDLAPPHNLMIAPASMVSTATRLISSNDSRPGSVVPTSGGSTSLGSPLIDLCNGRGPQPTIFTQTSAVEKPVLTAMLSRIFTKSLSLQSEAFDNLIDSLIVLAKEAAELGITNADPSPFAIAKLTEVGLANISRLEAFWDKIYSQLLSISKLPVLTLRLLSADALVVLIKQAIAYYSEKESTTFWTNHKIADLILHPLHELSNVSHGEVREIQLHGVEYILQCYGEKVGPCWLGLIRIIASICGDEDRPGKWMSGGVPINNEQLIRKSFSCFHLIVSDYLESLESECYTACIATATRFAKQSHDLNISLSAIECTLLIIEFLFRIGEEKISSEKCASLWLEVFDDLSTLCLDERHAIRKSAGQTLFNSVDCHANKFEEEVWKHLLLKVLFPLLDNLNQFWGKSLLFDESVESQATGTDESRSKLSAETVVLALSGISRTFVANRDKLMTLSIFEHVWNMLLKRIEKNAAITRSLEISLNSLTCFQVLLLAPDHDTLISALEDASTAARTPLNVYQVTSQLMLENGEVPPDINNQSSHISPDIINRIWMPAWQSWIQIAKDSVSIFETPLNSEKLSDGSDEIASIPFLSLLLDMLVLFLRRMPTTFESTSLFEEHVSSILRLSVLLPTIRIGNNNRIIRNDSRGPRNFFFDDFSFRPLTGGLSRFIGILIQKTRDNPKKQTSFLCAVIDLLAHLSKYAIELPKLRAGLCYSMDSEYQDISKVIPQSLVQFAQDCQNYLVDLYIQCAEWPEVISKSILTRVIKCLQIPLSLKYGCPHQSTWILACKNFINVLNVGVPIHKSIKNKDPELDKQLWTEIIGIFQDFLFSKQPLPHDMTAETFSCNQALDCHLVYMIRDLFLNETSSLPDEFLGRLIALLSLGATQGSGFHDIIQDANQESNSKIQNGLANLLFSRELILNSAFGIDAHLNQMRSYKQRDTLARVCFETVLSYALGGFCINTSDRTPHESTSNKTTSKFLMKAAAVAMGLPEPSVSVSRMAVRSIMHRCLIIMKEFNENARLVVKVPMSRPSVFELQFVFKATLSILAAVKSLSSSSNPIEPELNVILTQLYSEFVDCIKVSVDSPFLLNAIHTVLKEYAIFIHPNKI